MNSQTISQKTEDGGQRTDDGASSAPAFDYASAERTILDRAEFARLIRKSGHVSATVFVPDYLRREVVRGCANECFGVTIPAKQALAHLALCSYDAHVWELDEYGPHISFVVAPAWVQMKRRRDFVAARIPKGEARLALPPRGDRIDENFRAMTQRDLLSDRAELAKWDAELAARKAQPVAA